MIGESQVADAACLTLLQQEVEQPIVDESLVEGLQPVLAHSVHQVVVDIVDTQLLKRGVIHLLGLFQVPEFLVIVRHLGCHVIFVARVAAQGIAHYLLVHATTIHGCGVKVVDAMCDGIVYELVHQFLVVAWQAHHAKTQQRDFLSAAMLGAIGHEVLSCLAVVTLPCQAGEWVKRHHRHCATSHNASPLKKFTAV